MDGECGDCAGGEAGNGLDQRGGEAHMVVSHKGGLKLSCCDLCRRKSSDDEVKLKILWNLPRLRNEQLI